MQRNVFLISILTTYLSYSEQWDESGQQEGGAEDEVNEQRNQDESPKVHNVLVAYVTDASNRITVHGTHGEDGDGFHGWDEPGRQVEILTVGRDSFLTPFQPSTERRDKGKLITVKNICDVLKNQNRLWRNVIMTSWSFV